MGSRRSLSFDENARFCFFPEFVMKSLRTLIKFDIKIYRSKIRVLIEFHRQKELCFKLEILQRKASKFCIKILKSKTNRNRYYIFAFWQCSTKYTCIMINELMTNSDNRHAPLKDRVCINYILFLQILAKSKTINIDVNS